MLGAFSRRIVIWAIAIYWRTGRVLNALDVAPAQLRPAGIVLRSDPESQLTSLADEQRCATAGH